MNSSEIGKFGRTELSSAFATTKQERSGNEKDCVLKGVKLNELLELLEGEMEYDCKLGTRMAGLSGVIHEFDIVACHDVERIFIDLFPLRTSILDSQFSEEEAQEQLLISAIRLRAKSMDCGSNNSIMIRLCSYLSSTVDSQKASAARRDFDEIGVKLIEARDVHGAAIELKRKLEPLI